MSAEIGIVVAVLLAFIAIAVVARSLRLSPDEADTDSTRMSDLLAQRENAFQTLRDLDSDLAAGRLAEDDYRPMRVQALSQAAEIVAELDALNAKPATPSTDEPTPLPSPDGENAANFCSNCGTARRPEDVYCRRCGTQLTKVLPNDSA